ncbi:MAG: cyclic nucleotide-binding domain-containing protein [Chloroflexi bacterium]|nr:cyclic nucleotide-binding domain-containing protein [Chloroflexota bacterium]
MSRIHPLPNSTYLVDTAAGSILVNCPPETLKYILAQGLEPPQLILLPPDMPHGRELGSSGFVHQGINYASVEFLLYANFFGKQRNAHIITPTAAQAARLDRMLEETFTGPTRDEEYGADLWLRAECAAVGYYPPFGRAPTHSDLCRISNLETDGGDLGHGVRVELVGEMYHFYEGDEVVAEVSTVVRGTPRPLTLAPARPLLRHELTLQFIGGSDGFDPAGITTCFLAYLSSDVQQQATLFDTAAYLRMRLGNLGLSPRQISEVVLSHLHEDHLAGLPELLLMGDQRIRLLTCDVIYQSLLRVLSAMLNLSAEDVAALFDYCPLNPGQPLELDGRVFESIYAIHTIPTIAVRVSGLYYSGDMRYDEQWFDQLVQEGTLSDQRRNDLIHFAEGAQVLVQDAGGGAIHTTITPELLAVLAAKGQRVILAHTKQDELTADQSVWAGRVEFASSGHVSGMGAALAEADDVEVVETLQACPFLSRLGLAKIQDLATQVTITHHEAQDVIIRDGELSDGSMFVVHSGLVEIWSGVELMMVVGRGGSLGERGALEGWQRMNTLVARGDAQLLVIPREAFAAVATHLGLAEAFERADWMWRQAIFHDLLWSTLLDLALDFVPRQLEAGQQLFTLGDLAEEIYLLITGRIEVVGKEGQTLDGMDEPGTFFGGRGVLYNTLRNASAHAAVPSEVWALPLPALQRLQMVYPHILMHLRAVEGGRLGGK